MHSTAGQLPFQTPPISTCVRNDGWKKHAEGSASAHLWHADEVGDEGAQLVVHRGRHATVLVAQQAAVQEQVAVPAGRGKSVSKGAFPLGSVPFTRSVKERSQSRSCQTERSRAFTLIEAVSGPAG